jgi:mercuric ion transport protein
MNPKYVMIGGVLAAIGASLCCVGPLVLLSLGFGGAWLAYLTGFEPVRPVLLVLALCFLGLAFRNLYVVPRTCEPGAPCPAGAAIARQRIMFWIVTVPLLGLLAFPWIAPLFY